MASNESQTQEIRQLDKFQLNSITYNSNILVVGRPKSGKSTLIADLLFQISPQKFTNEIYTVGETHNIKYNFNKVRLPTDQEKYENETLRICDNTTAATARGYMTKVVNRENYLDLEGKSNKKILVIDNPELHFNDSLRMLITYQTNVDYFIQSVENTDEFGETNIKNIDYIFLFIGQSKFQREKLFLKLSRMFGESNVLCSLEMFNAVIDKNFKSGEYQCLVVVQSRHSQVNQRKNDISLYSFQADPDIFEFEKRYNFS